MYTHVHTHANTHARKHTHTLSLCVSLPQLHYPRARWHLLCWEIPTVMVCDEPMGHSSLPLGEVMLIRSSPAVCAQRQTDTHTHARTRTHPRMQKHMHTRKQARYQSVRRYENGPDERNEVNTQCGKNGLCHTTIPPPQKKQKEHASQRGRFKNQPRH